MSLPSLCKTQLNNITRVLHLARVIVESVENLQLNSKVKST